MHISMHAETSAMSCECETECICYFDCIFKLSEAEWCVHPRISVLVCVISCEYFIDMSHVSRRYEGCAPLTVRGLLPWKRYNDGWHELLVN